MLVVSRKATEQIMIGKDVIVTVSRISGKRVDLAISAPREVRILRAELDPLDPVGSPRPAKQLDE